MTLPGENFAFNLLNDDDFFDLFSSDTDTQQSNYDCTNHENRVAHEINLLANSMNFDENNDMQYSSSEYFTVNQFKSLKRLNESFSIMHLNIRSLNRNFEGLRLLMDNSLQSSFSVIGLTETWATQGSASLYSLPGYDFIENSRCKRIGGGVALYIKQNLDYIIHNGLNCMSEVVESLLVEIRVPRSKNILITVIYRPPNSNSKDFFEYLQDLIHNPVFNNKDCYIIGDFNIDVSKFHTLNTPQEFLDIMSSASFLPLITKPTRVTNHTATLIDNIFCNINPLPESGIVLSDISDHYPIFTVIPSPFKTASNTLMDSCRKITPNKLAKLKDSLSEVDWSEVYNTLDTNASYDIFMRILTSHLDMHIPVVKNKSCNYKKIPRLPWVSKSLLRSINRKNKLYYADRIECSEQSHRKYTSYKNVLTQILRIEKRKYFTNQIFLFKHDIKNTWKIINSAINKSKSKPRITKIKHNNTIIDDTAAIANTFNQYFSEIGHNLAQKIPPTQNKFYDFLRNPNPHSLFFVPLHKNELIDMVHNLKGKKSTGHDGIDNVLLKNIIDLIVDPLVHIFNLSLNSGIVPEGMKISKVIPVHKKGEKENICNYRPISLLTTLSKLLEKVVYLRLLNFLNTHNIISNSQFGFRQQHSTSHAILSFIEKVAKAIDKFYHTIGVFLDLSKAFDTIDHNILLHKLYHYGIRGRALEWFKSYLTNRKQFVTINGQSSVMQDVICGVPQGSLLGPLLFVLYINDIQNTSNTLSFLLFADDSNVFLSHPDPDTLVNIFNTELDKLLQWIRANKLSINLQKTKCMLFSNSVENLPRNIILENTVIEVVPTINFLGLTIDNRLSWKPHVDNICRIISRNIGVINKVKFYFPTSTLLMLYSTLILPYLNYGIIAWGNTHSTYLDRILLLQKKALRVICNVSWRSHTDELFFENNILKIHDLYFHHLGQFMYKLNNNSLPLVFDAMFHTNKTIHKYPTRQSNEFHLPLTRTIFAQSVFTSTGPKFWNSLNHNIIGAPSLNTFKAKLKKFLLGFYHVSPDSPHRQP